MQKSGVNALVSFQGCEGGEKQSDDAKLSGHCFCPLHSPLSGQRRPAHEHEGRCQNHHVRTLQIIVCP